MKAEQDLHLAVSLMPITKNPSQLVVWNLVRTDI